MNTPQFDLSAMLSTPQQTAVQQIPCDKLHPYHNHKFELYSGERLEDMVASIKENGVLSPIIVQPDGDGYEILIQLQNGLDYCTDEDDDEEDES